ncbi:hypothetical protein FHU33_4645 [Blastococcus colisei]|uniref:Uncharacterized protein n=1 Tax=Blastococcus colisei TaxID=1564162 RepID=A0A543P1M8_9ACTN|nr:hypothetical protein [Blastococcus colisei]TQN37968.1 hypothetical protein FHU33_4645 [Blastococcus colisei]
MGCTIRAISGDAGMWVRIVHGTSNRSVGNRFVQEAGATGTFIVSIGPGGSGLVFDGGYALAHVVNAGTSSSIVLAPPGSSS